MKVLESKQTQTLLLYKLTVCVCGLSSSLSSSLSVFFTTFLLHLLSLLLPLLLFSLSWQWLHLPFCLFSLAHLLNISPLISLSPSASPVLGSQWERNPRGVWTHCCLGIFSDTHTHTHSLLRPDWWSCVSFLQLSCSFLGLELSGPHWPRTQQLWGTHQQLRTVVSASSLWFVLKPHAAFTDH